MSNEFDFDIDDILSEIKERKSRERGREPSSSPPPPIETKKDREDGPLYRTTFDELDELIESTIKKEEPEEAAPKASSSPYAKTPKAEKTKAPADPTKKKEPFVFEALDESFAPDFFEFDEADSKIEDDPLSLEDLFDTPEETPKQEARPQRKPKEKAPREERKVSRPVENGSFDFEAFDEVTPLGQGPRRPRRRPKSQAGEGEQDGPLDYESHVRPLTDRARQRERYADLAKGKPATPAGNRRPAPEHSSKKELDFGGATTINPSSDTVDFATMIERSVEAATADTPLDSPHLGDEEQKKTPKVPEGHTPSRGGRFASPATGKSLKIEDIKKMDFKGIGGETVRDHDLYYEEDEEQDFEDGTYVNFREYRPTSDRVDVAHDIARTKVLTFARTAGTALLTFFLFFFTLAGSSKFWFLPLPKKLFPYPETIGNYLLTCTILIALVLLVNLRIVIKSLFNLFRMRANSESLASLAVIAALIQSIYATTHPEMVDPNKMNLYYSVAALTMLFTGIGRLSMLGRIQSNFKIVSSKLPKKGLQSAQSPGFCYDVTLEDSATKPTVAYASEANFFTDFLSLSFSDTYDVGINRSVAPVCLLGALIIGFGTRFLVGDTMAALSAFAATLAVCATLSVTFIESIPLGKLAKRLTPYGCMVSGNKAVENFCDTHSVILNDTDLFPEGNITLYGIKAFPDSQIDEAILDTASVLLHTDSALSHLFLDMIGGDESLLREVDDVVYENGMGISAWIDKKRVLIGNRLLMQNHGIMLPNDTYERENPGDPPGNPIYISNSGQVSARFLVNYNIDEELAYQLDQLGMQNRHLVVYTTDANINEQTIWEIYGYPLELITIMPSDLHGEYREMSAPREEMPAEIVYTGGASNFIAAILGTVSARASILSATVLQLLQIILGYGLIAFMSFMGYIGNLSIVQILIYQVFWLVATLIVQKVRRT